MLIEKRYAAVDADGFVVQSISRKEDHEGPNSPPIAAEGITYVLLSEPLDWSATTVSRLYQMIEGVPTLVETAALEDYRARAWESLKTARDAAEASDFAFGGVFYQPDVPRITGAALNALMAQLGGVPFSIDWTAADNSVVTLDGAQVQALGVTLAQQLAAAHTTGRELRALLAAASTFEEIDAITWPAPTEETPQ